MVMLILIVPWKAVTLYLKPDKSSDAEVVCCMGHLCVCLQLTDDIVIAKGFIFNPGVVLDQVGITSKVLKRLQM